MSISAVGIGGYNPAAVFQQNLFNEIDTAGTGSITKSTLEQAVTSAGGTLQGADALYAQLDPNNTGSVNEQQFSQNLPAPPFSGQVGAQLIGLQASGWPAASASGNSPRAQLAQSLFSQIDTNGSGSITQSELEQAVTSAGGTTQAADALYAKLDPNDTGSVSEQQFAQTLSQLMPHHHHFHSEQADAGNGDAQGALASLLSTTGGAGSPAQLAQSLFSQIDTNGTGAITRSELEQAVTAAGGTSQGADALYAQLDPNNTGSVSEQQFAQYLQPPSATGNTAQDALLALIQSPSTTSSASATGVTGVASAPSSSGDTAQDAVLALAQGLASNQGGSVNGTLAQGNSAQDAIWSLLQSVATVQPGAGSAGQDPLLAVMNSSNAVGTSGIGSGNTAQDALFALMQADSAVGANGNNSPATTSSSDLAFAVSLYQSQMNQQLFGSTAA
ncbi:MAG TPA: EF-hand domain-containing protein [Xanthobacteraceae bacterium]|nr:EF-hand domain-containing protein [Xanthobacteraceae bacterium]